MKPKRQVKKIKTQCLTPTLRLYAVNFSMTTLNTRTKSKFFGGEGEAGMD